MGVNIFTWRVGKYMDNNIFFVIIGDDEWIISENVRYLSQLILPKGMTAEYCIVPKNEEAFRIGQGESAAKYKVYLDQNVYIIDKYFVQKVVKAFEENEFIKLIGVRGYRLIENDKKLKIVGNNLNMKYDNNSQIQKLIEGTEYGVLNVQAVDNHVFVTVQDIDWNGENLKSQVIEASVELRKKGYQTAIIKGESAMTLFDNNILDE